MATSDITGTATAVREQLIKCANDYDAALGKPFTRSSSFLTLSPENVMTLTRYYYDAHGDLLEEKPYTVSGRIPPFPEELLNSPSGSETMVLYEGDVTLMTRLAAYATTAPNLKLPDAAATH